MKPYRYIFGPVPSRRLGRSLGIDLTPHKTCSFDCVFCQLGRTTQKTIRQKAYVPTDAVLDELKVWLAEEGHADYVTLSGSGEPTLHTGFGKILDFLRSQTLPSVLLTNGSLLEQPGVRRDAARADIVKISLSAWNQQSYEWINRPHRNLSFTGLVEGLKSFRKDFTGQLWLETFLLFGMNSWSADVAKIAQIAREIHPDRIQLNTVVRPAAEEFAAALSREAMQALCPLFDPPAEVIAEFQASDSKHVQVTEEMVLALLQRRPCTIHQIAEVFHLHRNEVAKYLGRLVRAHALQTVRENTDIYYSAVPLPEKSIKGDRGISIPTTPVPAG